MKFEWDTRKAEKKFKKQKERLMKKENKQELEDDLRPEYDLKSLLKSGIRGKYAHRFQKGTNIVLLEPDVASVFPNGEAVNEALRLVIQLRKLPKTRQSRTVRT